MPKVFSETWQLQFSKQNSDNLIYDVNVALTTLLIMLVSLAHVTPKHKYHLISAIIT